MLDADEIGKRGQATKRNAVNIDGYESDSSNEGFDARAEAKAKEMAVNGAGREEKSKQEEENDMFADLEERDGDEDEEVVAEGKKARKGVKFLEEEEIVGQEERSKGGGHVKAGFLGGGQGILDGRGKGKKKGKARVEEEDGEGESSSESDADDETRADVGRGDEEVGAGGKKEHAPKLDAFNMRGEQEEGRFDDQGNFVRKAADPDAAHDSWLEGVSKKDMKRAKEAAEKRDDELRAKRMEDDKVLTSDLLRTLCTFLDRGETVLEALARLGRGKKKERPKWQKKRRESGEEMDVDAQKDEEDPKERRRREAVEALTGAADQLLTRGQVEIYDTEREMLTRQYTRETGEAWVEPPKPGEDVEEGDADDREWEYRWSDARDGGEAHGPYDGKMMKAWNEAGYFGEGVEYRQIGETGWSESVDFA